MSYIEIIEALEQGLNVYWKNTGYKVFLENGQLYSIFKHNGYMCRLHENEYNDCFIGVNQNVSN